MQIHDDMICNLLISNMICNLGLDRNALILFIVMPPRNACRLTRILLRMKKPAPP